MKPQNKVEKERVPDDVDMPLFRWTAYVLPETKKKKKKKKNSNMFSCLWSGFVEMVNPFLTVAINDLLEFDCKLEQVLNISKLQLSSL